MNKIEQIQALKGSNGLAKSEAEKIVTLFSIKWSAHWQKEIELKSEAFDPFLSNT